jgi:hypothetical protein
MTVRSGEVACLRQFQGRLCGITVELSNASLVDDLSEFLRGLCLEVVPAGEHTLEVRFQHPIPSDDAAARLELDLYLRVWQAMNPDAWAARVGC